MKYWEIIAIININFELRNCIFGKLPLEKTLGNYSSDKKGQKYWKLYLLLGMVEILGNCQEGQNYWELLTIVRNGILYWEIEAIISE